jgi:hypothetical protein
VKIIDDEIHYRPREIAELGLIRRIGRATTTHGVYLQVLKLVRENKIGYVKTSRNGYPLIAKSTIEKFIREER